MKIHVSACGLCLFDAAMFAALGQPLEALAFLAMAAAAVLASRYGFIQARP